MFCGSVSLRCIGIGLLLLLAAPSCRKEEPGTGASKPPEAVLPDLRRCTRVEVQLIPSALRWLGITPDEEGILSRTELEYVQSMDTIVSTDTMVIVALANDVAEAEYRGVKSGVLRTEECTYFRCYQGDELVFSFTVKRGELYADGGRRFNGEQVWRSISKFVEPVRPYQWRVECSGNLRYLYGRLRRRYTKTNGEYPAYTEWCDVVRREVAQPAFLCPAPGGRNPEYYRVHQQTSHYAMNPHCGPDSPPDVVLLFEAKAGWNQYGGPALFTLDHHDPRGGCVLLNDGTVKFVRTMGELNQLRWK